MTLNLPDMLTNLPTKTGSLPALSIWAHLGIISKHPALRGVYFLIADINIRKSTTEVSEVS
jgi:hypothetical protein